MKDLFPEYYKGNYIPSHDRRWDETAFFVFDANILLNLYSYRKETRNKWFEAMAGLSDRIFMPYQIAVEYHRNLKTKIDSVKALTAADGIALLANSTTSQPLAKYHPLSLLNDELKSVTENTLASQKRATDAVEKWKMQFDSEWLEIRDRIASLYMGEKMGSQPSKDVVKQWCVMGKERYAAKVPPGYRDQQKGNNAIDDTHKIHSGNMYGDLFVWLEILSESTKRNAPAIFVSAEKKSDWVRKNDANEYVARSELSTEFLVATGQEFEFSTDERFYYWAEIKHGKVEGGSEEVRATVTEKQERQNIFVPKGALSAGINALHLQTEKICALLEIPPAPPSAVIEVLHERGLITGQDYSKFVHSWYAAKSEESKPSNALRRARDAYYILLSARKKLQTASQADYENFDLDEDENRDRG